MYTSTYDRGRDGGRAGHQGTGRTEPRAHRRDSLPAVPRARLRRVGVAELMAAAGFTHGGFYKHFGSKADLIAEASASGLSQTAARSEGVAAAEFVETYVSQELRDGRAEGCTIAGHAPCSGVTVPDWSSGGDRSYPCCLRGGSGGGRRSIHRAFR